MNDTANSPAALKVATIARRTGVSVRTLHYYEEIGLLKPSGRTSSGHRLVDPIRISFVSQLRSLSATVAFAQTSEVATWQARAPLGMHDPRQLVPVRPSVAFGSHGGSPVRTHRDCPHARRAAQ